MITLIQEPVIWFDYKGDEVCWNGTHYLSILTGGSFSTLEDMDEFWNSYEQASRPYDIVTREMALDAGDPSLEGQKIYY